MTDPMDFLKDTAEQLHVLGYEVTERQMRAARAAWEADRAALRNLHAEHSRLEAKLDATACMLDEAGDTLSDVLAAGAQGLSPQALRHVAKMLGELRALQAGGSRSDYLTWGPTDLEAEKGGDSSLK